MKVLSTTVVALAIGLATANLADYPRAETPSAFISVKNNVNSVLLALGEMENLQKKQQKLQEVQNKVNDIVKVQQELRKLVEMRVPEKDGSDNKTDSKPTVLPKLEEISHRLLGIYQVGEWVDDLVELQKEVNDHINKMKTLSFGIHTSLIAINEKGQCCTVLPLK
ncbi:hypothetical protein MY11210_003298 [Beauveria gryllotalpidicola]